MPSSDDLFPTETPHPRLPRRPCVPLRRGLPPRVDVFFYSYYIDANLLADRGVEARNPRPGRIKGWRLHLGGDSTLLRDPRHDAFGVIYSLTHEELDRLYTWPGVARYRPYPLLIDLLHGYQRVPALCFLLENEPRAGQPDPAHLDNLRRALRAHGLPADGIDLGLAPPHEECGLRAELGWLAAEFREQGLKDSVCQCGTARAIASSSDPDRFLAVFAAAAFLDQFVHAHFREHHNSFGPQFPAPRLAAHGSGGHAHPFWLFDRRGHGDTDIDTARVTRLFESLVGEGLHWLCTARNVPADGVLRALHAELNGAFLAAGLPIDPDRIGAIVSAGPAGCA